MNAEKQQHHRSPDAAASELKQHLKDISAQYWRSSYLMEIYISVLEEEARQANKESDLKAVGDRDEGMPKEYERAYIIAQDSLAEHQNMSNIRNWLSKDDTQQPRVQPIANTVSAPNTPGRQYKANGKF